MRVLVVEDYSPIRESVVQALEEAGFAVDASAGGEEGLWHARSADYDALVLDIVLPQLDGLSILKRLRQAGSRTPVLLLTAKDTIADRVAGLDLGVLPIGAWSMSITLSIYSSPSILSYSPALSLLP